jgi:hypothetical protein
MREVTNTRFGFADLRRSGSRASVTQAVPVTLVERDWVKRSRVEVQASGLTSMRMPALSCVCC